MMSIQNTLAQIEQRMAEKKAEIEAIDARMAPVDAEIDRLIDQQQALESQVQEATGRLNAARGDAEAYLKLKKDYGVLAATRMQLRKTAPTLE